VSKAKASMKRIVLSGLLALAPALGGCSGLRWVAHLLTPRPPTKTVKAQFDGLKQKTVAVAIFAGPETLLDYQTVQLELADAVGAELRRRVKKVTVINPLRVMRYQDEHPHWYAAPAEKLCRDLGVDYVLSVSLLEFSTRAPSSMHLFRGRIRAEACLYSAAGPRAGSIGGAAWRSEMISVTYPPESPLGIPADDDRNIRLATARLFADKLVKNFYDHKMPKQP